MKGTYLSGVAAIVLAASFGSSSTWAAETAALDNDEIIVTAQKRSENIQNVPAAITALSGNALKDRAVARLDDLQTVAPSLTVATSGVTQSVNIRGVGLASGNASASNGVATYVDGMFQPPVVTTNSFFDIGSIEVFRGPQGTFVGSNSTGGALFINSRNPDLGGINGYGQMTWGSYGRMGAEGALNLPLGETLAVRGAAYYMSRDSFFKNGPGLSSHPGSLKELAFRVSALWKPSSNFTALLKVENAAKDTGGYAWQPLPPRASAAPVVIANPFQLNYNTETQNDERSVQATLRLDYVTDGGVTFRSLSGFTRKRVFNIDDFDVGNTASRRRQWYINENEEIQEINIISPDDKAFKWVVGGYFQRNLPIVYINDFVGATPTLNILLHPTKITKGLFGQVTVPLGDTLSVDIGARESWYKVDAFGYVKLASNGLQVGDTGGRERDSRLTGKVAVNWKPNVDNLVYGFVARGYKAGGYQTPARTFRPETVIDYEFGWKSAFLDRHVRTQVGAFYYDYNDFQLDAIDRGTGLAAVFNIGKATIKGIEGQIQVNQGGFMFDGGFAYVDSNLKPSGAIIDTRAFAASGLQSNLGQCATGVAPGTPPTCVDFSPFLINTQAGPNLFSPKWTWNVSAAYRFDAGAAAITPRVSYAYVGPQFTYAAYDPRRDQLAARGLLSASVNVDINNIQVQFYGTNLTDKVYIIGQSTGSFYGSPREYGVRVKATF